MKSRAETTACTAAHYTVAVVILSNQHPSTRAGTESIQLIYSRRALRALSDLARQFRCHPIFWREFDQQDTSSVLKRPQTPPASVDTCEKVVHEYITSDIEGRRARAVQYQPRVSTSPRMHPLPNGGPADGPVLTIQRVSPSSSQGRITWVLCAQIGQTSNALPRPASN